MSRTLVESVVELPTKQAQFYRGVQCCLIIKEKYICRDADKSLAFPISYFPICSTTKRIFLGWVKEVTTASVV
jgi:hypothetical protein